MKTPNTRNIKNVSNGRTVQVISFATPADFLAYVTPIQDDGSWDEKELAEENEKRETALARALNSLESHFRYHVVNAKIKEDKSRKDEATKEKPYVPVTIPLDLPAWLLTKVGVRGEDPTEADKKLAAGVWTRTQEKLDAIDGDDTKDDTEKHEAKVAVLNRLAERLNPDQHKLAQLPTLDEAFDEEGEPNEHPLDLRALEVALRKDRVEKAADKAKRLAADD